MTGEDKPSEKKSPESELSVIVVPVHDSKKEKMDPLAFSSAIAELVVDSKEDKQISEHGE